MGLLFFDKRMPMECNVHRDKHHTSKALSTSDGMNPSIVSPTVAAVSSTGCGICSSTLPATSSGVSSCGNLNCRENLN